MDKITLNPRKSTVIIQVEEGMNDLMADQRIDVILGELGKVVNHQLPSNYAKFKVENRIIYDYSHDPYWVEMHQRHKKEKEELEAYLQNIDKSELDDDNIRRFAARQYNVKRISVQI